MCGFEATQYVQDECLKDWSNMGSGKVKGDLQRGYSNKTIGSSVGDENGKRVSHPKLPTGNWKFAKLELEDTESYCMQEILIFNKGSLRSLKRRVSLSLRFYLS